jgi:hypothetical protein
MFVCHSLKYNSYKYNCQACFEKPYIEYLQDQYKQKDRAQRAA